MPRRWLVPAAVFTAVLTLALPSLVEPFAWDQAMFALGGEVLATGGALYRDFWDFKPPGVFVFFAAAHLIGGRAEWAAHALELLAWFALAVVLMRGCGALFRRPATSHWAPLIVCGTYFSLADDHRLLQVEGLLALPLTAGWLAARASASAATRGRQLGWAACAGVAAGCVAVTKPVYAPLVLALALPAIVESGRRQGAATLATVLAVGAAAALVPAGVLAAHFAAHGTLALAWDAVVVAPLSLLARLDGLPVANWRVTLDWALRSGWPLLLLAAGGAALAVRRRERGLELVLWIVVGGATLVAQRWSGWPHHLWLVLVPVGLLALRALESLALAGGVRRVLFAAALVALAATPFARGAERVARLVAEGVPTHEPAWREAMRARSTAGAYRRYESITAWLREPDAPPGPIVVLGNPLACWISGRRSAIALPGGASFYDDAGWQLMARQIEGAASALVLLEDPMLEALAPPRTGPRPVREVLRRDYVEVARVDRARWLARTRP